MTTATNDKDEFKVQLIAVIPHLRAHARYLTGNIDQADDLVQDALTKAWSSAHQFDPSTSLRAWITTILRNHFLSERRRDKFSGEWNEQTARQFLVSKPVSLSELELEDVRLMIAQLPDSQRDALQLVAIEEFSYEQAAQICECNIGTIKSRVARARKALSELNSTRNRSETSKVDEFSG